MTNGRAAQNPSSGLKAGEAGEVRIAVDVGADGVEGDVAEVEQAGEADDDVQAQAQQDVDARPCR